MVCAHPHKELRAIVKHGVQHEDVSVERKVTLAYQFATLEDLVLTLPRDMILLNLSCWT